MQSGIKKRVSIFLTILKEIMASSKEARQVYTQGEILQLGETLFMNDFAETLAYLAEKGKEFYEGEIATVGERLPKVWWILNIRRPQKLSGYRKTTTHHRLSRIHF